MAVSPVQPNQILAGRYRVDRVLGQGGMGVVVDAEHLRLGHHVAIKLLLPECASSPDIVARFLNEAKAAARIRSDHVVRVSDVGELEDGAPYMVMELMSGKDLGEILRTGGPLPVERAVTYVLQACHGISEAHSLGIIHRDLKPSNLFLTMRSDGAPLVKVLDFGISKITGPESGGSVTETGWLFGSPRYMSPEQLRSAKDLDRRTDIWSLGIILHELLTGCSVFGGETMGAIFFEIATAKPTPLRMLRPDVPPALEQVVLRCLEKDPALRYTSIDELTFALRTSIAAEAPTSMLSGAPEGAPFANAMDRTAHYEPRRAERIDVQPARVEAIRQPTAATFGVTAHGPGGRTAKRTMAVTAMVAFLVAGLGGAWLVLRGPGTRSTQRDVEAMQAAAAPPIPMTSAAVAQDAAPAAVATAAPLPESLSAAAEHATPIAATASPAPLPPMASSPTSRAASPSRTPGVPPRPASSAGRRSPSASPAATRDLFEDSK